MKLRNKKTGEIVDCAVYCNGTFYHSVNDVFEEWEDYEEPKEYWRIDWDGEIIADVYEGTSFDKDCKAIGNYFETKEEAEKAVEKLKALTRLKNKGFRIALHGYKGNAWLEANWGNLQDDYSDVLILFGGEE